MRNITHKKFSKEKENFEKFFVQGSVQVSIRNEKGFISFEIRTKRIVVASFEFPSQHSTLIEMNNLEMNQTDNQITEIWPSNGELLNPLTISRFAKSL